ncbi:aspartyl-phosphate phosphatase Spo0E family protein [Domibacillus indicus]|uniref:aspartyl-phosphate phosphatase Spo0E family protein n=1 Tax=Domibacillus indicus TaxID=1437523 RepID=UPI00203AEA83|nr:aspartyl-phosphate phosphatase Spo0E family protein [Domibacillus indicus]MCM3790122.1 aspartyl-phosphate phosphatase Spo0E family protein [Domibacillus indicus]
MILKNVIDLRKNIRKHRQDMYELANCKGIAHPDVIKASQQLDEEIVRLQKIIQEIRLFS